MSDIQVLFSPTSPSSVEYSDLDDDTFFEFDSTLYYKINDGVALKIENGGIDSILVDEYEGIDSDTRVTIAPAGVGFTLIQSA